MIRSSGQGHRLNLPHLYSELEHYQRKTLYERSKYSKCDSETTRQAKGKHERIVSPRGFEVQGAKHGAGFDNARQADLERL